jgi:hypothetical protein
VLKKPNGDAIFFSGEALDAGTDMGTVEAALASGQETAQTILTGTPASPTPRPVKYTHPRSADFTVSLGHELPSSNTPAMRRQATAAIGTMSI